MLRRQPGPDGGWLLMSRTKLTVLGLLAVIAVAVVASASATEPPKKCGLKVEKTPVYCVEGFQLENAKGESAPASVSGTNGVSILKATVASVKAEIECKKGKSTGFIEDGFSGTVGKSTASTTFEECKLLKPTNCKLPTSGEKITTTNLMGELALIAGRVEDKVEPKEGAGFAGVSIEGKDESCVIAEVGRPQTFNITGSQLCEFDESTLLAETNSLTHKIICKTSGSSLKLGGNKAEMTSESTIGLTSGKKWNVKEGV
jgi:hypothetical protein